MDIELERRPTPPGTILWRHYLEPTGLTVSAFAREIGLSRKHVSDIVNGRVRVTPAVAVMLAHALDTSPSLWLNLQAAVDIHDAEADFAARTKGKPKAA